MMTLDGIGRTTSSASSETPTTAESQPARSIQGVGSSSNGTPAASPTRKITRKKASTAAAMNR
jgi:hypothetical protein